MVVAGRRKIGRIEAVEPVHVQVVHLDRGGHLERRGAEGRGDYPCTLDVTDHFEFLAGSIGADAHVTRRLRRHVVAGDQPVAVATLGHGLRFPARVGLVVGQHLAVGRGGHGHVIEAIDRVAVPGLRKVGRVEAVDPVRVQIVHPDRGRHLEGRVTDGRGDQLAGLHVAVDIELLGGRLRADAHVAGGQTVQIVAEHRPVAVGFGNDHLRFPALVGLVVGQHVSVSGRRGGHVAEPIQCMVVIRGGEIGRVQAVEPVHIEIVHLQRGSDRQRRCSQGRGRHARTTQLADDVELRRRAVGTDAHVAAHAGRQIVSRYFPVVVAALADGLRLPAARGFVVGQHLSVAGVIYQHALQLGQRMVVAAGGEGRGVQTIELVGIGRGGCAVGGGCVVGTGRAVGGGGMPGAVRLPRGIGLSGGVGMPRTEGIPGGAELDARHLHVGHRHGQIPVLTGKHIVCQRGTGRAQEHADHAADRRDGVYLGPERLASGFFGVYGEGYLGAGVDDVALGILDHGLKGHDAGNLRHGRDRDQATDQNEKR